MYLPSVLRPLPVMSSVNPAVQLIAEAPFSVVRGAPGSFVAERLAGVIDSWDRLADCVWLRASDSRSEELVKSLAAACRHRWAKDDADDGPPGLRLSEEITRAPDGAVIILELGGRMTPGSCAWSE